MDKIAEHIAKFKMIKEDMQESLIDGGDSYKLKSVDELITCIIEFGCGETEFHTADIECLIKENQMLVDLFLKHEQKGEQMKSIELSEEEMLTKKEREVIQECLQIGFNKGKIPYLTGDALCKKLDKYLAENAKPIPTEPRWSEKEILEAGNEWMYSTIFKLIERLKTPKPRLREMDIKEKEAWIVKLVFDYTDKSSGDKIKIEFKGECFECGLLGFLQDDSDCTHY